MRPAQDFNNLWYEYNDSDTVLVFVHGILSDSRSCWYHEDEKHPDGSCYWPDLILDDARLSRPSIYLGGYYTAIDSGPYDIRSCSRELFSCLKTRDKELRPPVMDKENIVFICHSTGGIVARYLLVTNYPDFVNTRVGLILIASPSYGSKYANKLDWLAEFYKQELGQQLKWGNWSLKDLDAQFKDLVYKKRIPDLSGVEACENHFIFHRKYLPDKRVVVNKLSAGRYFGDARLLGKTNHFSAVKPDNDHHPAHQLLVDFLAEFQGGHEISSLLTRAATQGPAAAISGPIHASDSANAVPPTMFHRITEFWQAEPGVLQDGQRVTITGTMSKFAPLLILPPQEKRRLHWAFRDWLSRQDDRETETEVDVQTKATTRAQIDAHLAYSAGQMVWRVAPTDGAWIFMGLYQSIVRNSIPIFIERQYYNSNISELFSNERTCIDAKVTGRLGRLRATLIKDLIDPEIFTGVIRPVIKDEPDQPVFGLFIDGNDTSVEYLRDTTYLDGDIWIAIQLERKQLFVSRFIDLSDPIDLQRESQLLKLSIKERYPDAEVVFEYDQVDKIFPEYVSTTTDRILSQLVA